MFEQESYDRATEPTVVSQPGELFYNYEMKSWFSTQTLYKVLAISAVLNLAFLAAVSQTNVLTARGCDSPWVGRVCQVVDMAYVGALLFGTEREYADVAYERTELGPEDEIIYVIQDGKPLEYPEGYFQIANPVDYQNKLLLQQGGLVTPSGTTLGSTFYNPVPNNDSDILKQRANPPAANPGAFTDDSPDSSILKEQDSPSTNVGSFPSRKGRGGRIRPPGVNTETKKPDDSTVANTQTPQVVPTATPGSEDEAKADKFGVFINKRPLKDRAKETVEQVEAKDLKLDKSFKVVIEGTLGLAKDGKTTVLKNPKLIPTDPKVPNDPEMVKLAQDWILAVGDAGWLGYLERIDLGKKAKTKKVVITVEQNDIDFVASVRSELGSGNEANTLATSLRNWMTLGALGADADLLKLLEATTTGTDGNALILNVKFEKPIVQELIQRKLAEAKAEKTEPTSTAVNSAKSTTASK